MSQLVYTGQWTDWSQSHVFGERVTMTGSHAAILIAFIAVFDGIVGNTAWRIASYYVHRARTTNLPRDGLHHQIQVLLRNSAEPLSFVQTVTNAGWSWRGRVTRPMLRTIGIALIPLVISLLFSAAGVFSSQIASTGEVLLTPGTCGSVVVPDNLTTQETINYEFALLSEDASLISLSIGYAQQCYGNPFSVQQSSTLANQFASSTGCGSFVKSSLNYTYSLGNPCPFEDACSVSDDQIIKLDTGYLDSHYDLGQNQPLANRVLFRKVMTCSPLKTEGFSNNSFHDYPPFGPYRNLSTYSYGANLQQPTKFLELNVYLPSNETTFLYDAASYLAQDSAYYLMFASTMDANAYFNGSNYTPSTKISSDPTLPISLFFLANRAQYYEGPVTDPWFNATVPLDTSLTVGATTLFLSLNPGSVLACLEQVEICNPAASGGPNCTGLNDWYTWSGIPQAFLDIGLNPLQQDTASNIQDNLLGGAAWQIVNQLGPASLLAENYITSQGQLYSIPLGPTQWHNEVANWFTIGLAYLQRNYLSQYRKPANPTLQQYFEYFWANQTDAQQWCASQKVVDTGFTSFSVLGLGLNFALGALIILYHLFISQILPRLPRLGKNKHRVYWMSDGSLQLQRTAYEKLDFGGSGNWEGNGSVPVMKTKGQLFKPPTLRAEGNGGRNSQPLGWLRGRHQQDLKLDEEQEQEQQWRLRENDVQLSSYGSAARLLSVKLPGHRLGYERTNSEYMGADEHEEEASA